MNYDGMYGSLAKVHTEDRYANESIVLPENVREHFKKSKNHSGVYVPDRGQFSTAAFGEMRSKDGLLFVGRLLENRKLLRAETIALMYRRRWDIKVFFGFLKRFGFKLSLRKEILTTKSESIFTKFTKYSSL
jgi:IS4 transposase